MTTPKTDKTTRSRRKSVFNRSELKISSIQFRKGRRERKPLWRSLKKETDKSKLQPTTMAAQEEDFKPRSTAPTRPTSKRRETSLMQALRMTWAVSPREMLTVADTDVLQLQRKRPEAIALEAVRAKALPEAARELTTRMTRSPWSWPISNSRRIGETDDYKG